MTKTKPKTPVLFVRGLRRKEKDAYKALCANNGSNMTQELLKFIRRSISGGNVSGQKE